VRVNARDPTEDMALPAGALITHVRVPLRPGTGGSLRASSRELADWATVEVNVQLLEDGGTVKDARVVLGAVSRAPRRAKAAEAALVGKRLTLDVAKAAAARAADGATPLARNAYKAKLVEGAVLALLLRLGRLA
jgi:xanthine dehydrogenase YagS FAD-binding subunit